MPDAVNRLAPSAADADFAEPATAEVGASDDFRSSGPPPAHGFWRDNLEALLMAIVMALFLKQFVVEAYKIPTGSMQPTLIGDAQAEVQDRILVDKLSYVVRAPERWEVAVFTYPLDRAKTLVKRIVGVGPEELTIRYGDLWRRETGGEWQILRRPRAVMEEHWKKLDDEQPLDSRWVPRNLPAESEWRFEGRAIAARGAGFVGFRGASGSITDGYLDGYPESLRPWMPASGKESDQYSVGDLRVSGTVTALAGLVALRLVLTEGPRSYRCELAGPGADAAADSSLEGGAFAAPDADLPARLPYRLPAGRAVRFSFQNLDDRLELELDGEPLLALELQPAEDQTSSVSLALEGEGADLAELMVARDIYYTTPLSEPFVVAAGHYFMLGDNTQDSSDSREWRYVIFEQDDGAGGTTTVRGNWRDRENPRIVGYGDVDGPQTYLVDEWGEKHWFERDEARRRAPLFAPLVPRELVHGRAMAVFWPLDPVRGIWRLKWVH